MLLQFGAHGVTMSWDDGFLGARASRPHQAWHSLGHLPHLDQPGTAPWVSFDLADAVPADRVVACSIARKLSGGQRDRMRAGRPRSQAMPSRLCGGGCLAGDFSESRPAPCGKLPFARQPCARPPRLGRSIEKDYKWNMDAQDAQDNQDGRLLQETLTRAMIACGFEDVREHKPAVSGKNPVHPLHRCESKIYPCLTMNRFPATRRRRLFQASRAPALVCGSYKSETIRNRSSLRDLGIPSRLTSTP